MPPPKHHLLCLFFIDYNKMENYYNPKTGLSGVFSMYRGQNKYTLAQIKEMIKKQEAYQLNK